MTSLADITHLVIDLDGVLYRGDQPLPGLREFFAFLRQRPIPFILATNNSTRTPQEVVGKLARMGVEVFPEEVLTSGQATARYLAREYPRGRESTSSACRRFGKLCWKKDLCRLIKA